MLRSPPGWQAAFFHNTGEKVMISDTRNKNQTGFTLVELVVVLLLTGILVAAITPFVFTNVQAFIRIRQAKVLMQGARVGLLRMTEELKRAEPNSISGDSNDIEFDFEDSNGNTHFNINYDVSNNCLRREGGYNVIIPYVQNFTLSYYNATGGSSSTANANTRRIQIEIKVGPSSSQKTTLRTQVTLRNLF
jgi:MSHA biogenesis protein MshO